MMKKLPLMLAALTFSGSLMAQTLVTVNGTKLDSSEIDRRAQLSIQQSQGEIQDGPSFRRYLIQQYVVETAIAQEAKRLKLDKTDDYKNTINDAKKEIKSKGLEKTPDYQANWAALENQVLGNLFELDVLNKNPITAEQVQARYNEIKNRYNNTDEVQIGQIITQTQDKAQAAIKALSAKKGFDSVAKTYSIDPAAQAGQAVNPEWIPLVDLQVTHPKIYQEVHSLKKGQFNKKPVVSGSDNQQIFVVYYINNRHTIQIPALENMQQDIGRSLADERINQAINEVLQKADIVPAK